MSNKNITITGGNGYLGSRLKIALEKKGYDVEVYDLPKNILNANELCKVIIGKDVVYHLAALAELSYTDAHPRETYEVNIRGTNNIAKCCAENGVLLNFASTSCAYGDPLEKPSIEDRLVNPTDTYAMSKMAGEFVVKMWGLSRGLKYNILRFGTVYGQSTDKKMRGDMACQKFMEAAVNKTVMKITGDGEQARNFIHIDDLVRALVLIADKDVVGETINLAGKERITINNIADYALKFGATGKKYTPKRKDDFVDQCVSIEKAKRLLGWEPEISFEKGITDFYKWIKANKC